ncbi:hypothetical protein LOTGIDRAFT_236835 [Lottia gigantea]|uniref:UBZ4-type domain-containing protein n=1 Tax=Lottia gigantea TaxID=225164 RepID=V3YY49_LOTGI|nr:hypothetical protein LOTGIDRAFT_236835 [Lottia gigantea]ESO83048.1 hypothetical protein LOTGIDRAFT_236835 [Lottia gigantea]
MESNEISECPVCGESFAMTSIEQHVNECLNAADNTTQRSRKRKSSELSSTAWGCLRPQTNQNETESSETVNKRHKINVGSENPRSDSPIVIEEDSRSSGSPDILVTDSSNVNDKSSSEDQTSTSDSRSKSTTNSNTKQTSFFQKKKLEMNGDKMPQSKSQGIEILSRSSNPSPVQQVESSSSSSSSNLKQSTFNPFFQKRSTTTDTKKTSFKPLAEQMRPSSLERYVGQEKAVGKKSMLHSLLLSDHIPSMILWGPPGCGKEVIKVAKNDQKMFRRKTVMFLDEIHRFNKTQQDSLLPHVEDGTITLIGATTENPSFQVNSALLSRCRVIVLEKLSTEALKTILIRAVEESGGMIFQSEDEMDNSESCEPSVWVADQALEVLANLCDGDARSALNSLQMALQSQIAECNNGTNENKDVAIVTVEHVKTSLQRSHITYDKTGEEHYNTVSALQKSIRGSDDSAALYWLMRMLEGGEDPLYIARRLVRTASEDIGLADPQALNQSVAAFQACHFLGMPECGVILAQCAVYLARAPKSVEITAAYSKVKKCIQEHEGPLPGVPLHLRNATSKLNKSLGYGKGYKYNPAFKTPVKQDYLPEELIGTNFFT